MGKQQDKKKLKRQAKTKAEADAEIAAVSDGSALAVSDVSASEAGVEPKAKMSRKEFEKEPEKLQIELVKMQEWVKASGAKVCVLFEGRDAAGKGGVIKRITERTSPRVFRLVALPSPTEREKSQMYLQRYIPHLPAAGEVVLFDRSGYNRAGVERVMGFATETEVTKFLRWVPAIEFAMIQSGIILVKYWLEETMEDQTERFEERITDYRKILEAQPDGPREPSPLVRLLAGSRCHVYVYGYPPNALVRCELARPAARPTELHRPPAESDPLRGSPS